MTSEAIDVRAKEIHKLLEQEARKKSSYQDRQRMTNRYALERFLYRVSKSPHADKFVLKGAMLLAIYVPEANRPSKDADFQLRGVSTLEGIRSILQDICKVSYDDGLIFNIDEIAVRSVGAEREYPGYTASIPARLGALNCPIHLDFGFGEAITPPPTVIEYPSMLSLPRPRLKVYPISTIIAEKFEALVNLGMSNSRMKDLYDLSKIADYCEMDSDLLIRAITSTFETRQTDIPSDVPVALTSAFYSTQVKVRDWKAFLKSSSLPKDRDLRGVCMTIEAFLMPLIHAITRSEPFHRTWKHGDWIEK